jgi:hypothetical protein
VKPPVIEPVDVLEDRELHVVEAGPGSVFVGQLGLVEAVERPRLGRCRRSFPRRPRRSLSRASLQPPAQDRWLWHSQWNLAEMRLRERPAQSFPGAWRAIDASASP